MNARLNELASEKAEPVDVPSGTSTDWAQWVGGPLEQDYDVIDITGGQSVSGHHAILRRGHGRIGLFQSGRPDDQNAPSFDQGAVDCSTPCAFELNDHLVGLRTPELSDRPGP